MFKSKVEVHSQQAQNRHTMSYLVKCNVKLMSNTDVDVLLSLGCVTKIQRQPDFNFQPKCLSDVNLRLHRRLILSEDTDTRQ